MAALRHQITGRSKVRAIAVARPDDFQLGPAQDFDAAHLTRSRQWSLYAIDPEGDRAIFVELPDGVDLGAASFAYGAQFEHARSVASVSLGEFVTLSAELPASGGLAMLYSTGRCGSTLASRILANIPNVWSVSEPDCLTNLVFSRFAVAPDRMHSLLRAARNFICALAPAGATVVIKPRSEQTFQVAEFGAANPDARAVFMYRDAPGYANSMFRLVQRATGNRDFLTDPDARQLGWFFASAGAPEGQGDAYLDPGAGGFSNLEAIVLGWTLRIRAIESAAAAGVAVIPLHYADLNRDRAKFTGVLLRACGISVDHVDLGLRGFEQDAHAGGATANTVPTLDLNPEQAASVMAMLQRWNQPAMDDQRLTL